MLIQNSFCMIPATCGTVSKIYVVCAMWIRVLAQVRSSSPMSQFPRVQKIHLASLARHLWCLNVGIVAAIAVVSKDNKLWYELNVIEFVVHKSATVKRCERTYERRDNLMLRRILLTTCVCICRVCKSKIHRLKTVWRLIGTRSDVVVDRSQNQQRSILGCV